MAKKKKTKARVKAKKGGRRAPRSQLSKDLEVLVGSEVYSTWIKMLAQLVPWGRTERLSVLVAAMLQYAASCKYRGEEENSAVGLLQESADVGMDYEDQERILPALIEVLFKDAGVKWKRTNARGQGYSIAEEAMEQFLRWDFMPWE